MKATIYIKTETDEALSKLGGANRAENLRRAVALAEVAGELAEAADKISATWQGSGSVNTAHMADLIFALNQYEAAKAREAKQ